MEDRPGATVNATTDAHETMRNAAEGEQGGHVDTLAGLGAPEKKRKAGRPTNSRDKALYEELSKRTRFCSICRGKGHKKTTCPEVKCSNCGIAGHRKNTCTNPEGVKLQTALYRLGRFFFPKIHLPVIFDHHLVFPYTWCVLHIGQAH